MESKRSAVNVEAGTSQRNRVRSRVPARLVLLAVVAVLACGALVFPYLSLSPGSSRVEIVGGLYWALLLGHIFTAAVALVLGPVQLILVRRGRRAVHRKVGRFYLLLGVVPSATLALPVALASPRGLGTQVGLAIPAVLWLVTATVALRSLRHGDITGHGEWMARNYALTFLAVTSRAVVPFVIVTLRVAGFADVDRSSGQILDTAIQTGQWLGWSINLTVVEVLIRRRRSRRTARAT